MAAIWPGSYHASIARMASSHENNPVISMHVGAGHAGEQKGAIQVPLLVPV